MKDQRTSWASFCRIRPHCSHPRPTITSSSHIHHSTKLSSSCLFSSYSRVSSSLCYLCISRNCRVTFINSIACPFSRLTSSSRIAAVVLGLRRGSTMK